MQPKICLINRRQSHILKLAQSVMKTNLKLSSFSCPIARTSFARIAHVNILSSWSWVPKFSGWSAVTTNATFNSRIKMWKMFLKTLETRNMTVCMLSTSNSSRLNYLRGILRCAGVPDPVASCSWDVRNCTKCNLLANADKIFASSVAGSTMAASSLLVTVNSIDNLRNGSEIRKYAFAPYAVPTLRKVRAATTWRAIIASSSSAGSAATPTPEITMSSSILLDVGVNNSLRQTPPLLSSDSSGSTWGVFWSSLEYW